MDMGAKLLVSAVPVICETVILQELYMALYKEKVSIQRRVLYGLIFIAIQYPIVFFTDNPEFLAHLRVIRSVLIFLLYALMLRTVFGDKFLSRCLPAAAVFGFISVVIETILWFGATWLGYTLVSIRYTLGKVLIFQGILYAIEFMIVQIFKKIKFSVGYSEKMAKRLWLSTIGYLLVISIFWIGLIQQVGDRFREGNISTLDILSIIVCLLVSLLFIKSSMDISREIDQQQWKIETQKLELDYQKLYNNGMEAMFFEMSRFRHNYNNTLAALQGYAATDDFVHLKEYIGELCRKKNIVLNLNREALSQIKNGAIAGLLAAKMLKAENSHITFKLVTDGELEHIKMHIIEFCEVLGILLDNAVEAATTSSDKYVKLEISGTDSGWIFHLENSVNKKPNIPHMFEKGYTTKPKGSGLGLFILEEILHKYPNSSLNTFADDKHFIQELCIM